MKKTKATSKKDTKEPLVIFLDEFRAKVCVVECHEGKLTG